MYKKIIPWLLFIGLCIAFTPIQAGTSFKNQISFKIMKTERETSVNRFAQITRDQFDLQDIQTVQYDEKDIGFAVTDSYQISKSFDFFATAEYVGQYQTQITLLNGDQYEITENILFGYVGLMYERDLGEKISIFGMLGYGYYRDRVRAYDLSKSELDPPEETLYHTTRYEDFTHAFELGLTWHLNEIIGLTFSYEKTEILDVKQTALISALTIRY